VNTVSVIHLALAAVLFSGAVALVTQMVLIPLAKVAHEAWEARQARVKHRAYCAALLQCDDFNTHQAGLSELYPDSPVLCLQVHEAYGELRFTATMKDPRRDLETRAEGRSAEEALTEVGKRMHDLANAQHHAAMKRAAQHQERAEAQAQQDCHEGVVAG
jgi:hypothetical protein